MRSCHIRADFPKHFFFLENADRGIRSLGDFWSLWRYPVSKKHARVSKTRFSLRPGHWSWSWAWSKGRDSFTGNVPIQRCPVKIAPFYRPQSPRARPSNLFETIPLLSDGRSCYPMPSLLAHRLAIYFHPKKSPVSPVSGSIYKRVIDFKREGEVPAADEKPHREAAADICAPFAPVLSTVFCDGGLWMLRNCHFGAERVVRLAKVMMGKGFADDTWFDEEDRGWNRFEARDVGQVEMCK